MNHHIKIILEIALIFVIECIYLTESSLIIWCFLLEMLFEDSNPKNLQVRHQSCFFVSGLLSHRIHVSFTINVGKYTIHGSYHYKVENTRAVLSFQAYYTNHWFQDPSFTLISSIRNGHRINRGYTSHHPHHVTPTQCSQLIRHLGKDLNLNISDLQANDTQISSWQEPEGRSSPSNKL